MEEASLEGVLWACNTDRRKKWGGEAAVQEGWWRPSCFPGSVPWGRRACGCGDAPAAGPKGTAPGWASHSLWQGSQQNPSQIHLFLSLCKANPLPLPKWLLADIYTGESRIRPAESLPPCPHGNDAGCCRAELLTAQALEAGPHPRSPGRRALEQEEGVSLISILS